MMRGSTMLSAVIATKITHIVQRSTEPGVSGNNASSSAEEKRGR
jgi:hypothetical protein